MDNSAIMVLSLGVAMDAGTVCVAHGLASSTVRARDALSVAAWFGGFQTLMPMVGWWGGGLLGPLVHAWGPYIAAAVFAALGAKILWDARRPAAAMSAGAPAQLFGARVMCALAIATSIDALVVGVTLPLLHAPFALTVVSMGVTTATLCVLGLYAGRHIKQRVGQRINVVGGVLLLALAAWVALSPAIGL